MKPKLMLTAVTFFVVSAIAPNLALAQEKKPNILFIVSDDTGYGDLGPYGGGEGRGMPTPNIDRLARGGVTLFSSLPPPGVPAGPAALITGRFPNPHRTAAVAFQR